ncbi:MAG: DNA topoisomerase [Candidatus Bathyarchaeia archaeon]|nr:DNA topoisomerase III [Candidatus Bathyarchaeota archaeon]
MAKTMLVVTEKPSVARSIERVIKPEAEIVALSGHMLNLDFPEKYSNWWNTNPKDLFHVETKWVIADRRAYESLTGALKGAGDPIVLATDNDHEGELIAYEALLTAQDILGKPRYMRMRFNTVSESELKDAWSRFEPDLNWGWVRKALFRQKFDLTVGAAYTRLLTISARRDGQNVKLISYGSCQTPTLWFVYERDIAIRNFKPETYYVVWALLDNKGVKVKVSTETMRDKAKAKVIHETARKAKDAVVKEYSLKVEDEQKPLPTDTDAMLRELTRILGLSSSKIMSAAEDLYANGYISYPRTETNMWVRVNHKEVLDVLSRTPLSRFIHYEDFSPISGKKNDGAHPPIHPIKPYLGKDVSGRIWEYIARRYLANTVGRNAVFERWKLSVDVNGVKMDAVGRYIVEEGFYEVFPYFRPKDLQWIPELKNGQILPILEVGLSERKTKPPSHLTESELLRLMERHGIGTDATRHIFPTLIVNRGYAVKKRRSFLLTKQGESLIKMLRGVDERLVTPETRRYVEQMMIEVESGRLNLEEALSQSIKIYEQLYDELSKRLIGH